jgi:hypothetical protein
LLGLSILQNGQICALLEIFILQYLHSVVSSEFETACIAYKKSTMRKKENIHVLPVKKASISIMQNNRKIIMIEAASF